MKRSKLKNNNAVRKITIPGVVLLIVLSFVVLVSALTSDERNQLQNELNNLTAELSNQGYSWLTDYNLTYSSPSVGVYRENSDELITSFNTISNENWYKIYLTNLLDNESYDVFYLSLVGDGCEGRCSGNDGVPYEIYLKRMRIDKIREELNKEEGNV